MPSTTEKRDKLYATGLTVLVHLILFAIFILIVFRTPIPPYPEGGGSGIAVNFGTSDEGFGDNQPEQFIPINTKNIDGAENVTNAESESESEVLTQNSEEAPAVSSTEKPKNVQKKPIENAQKVKLNDPVVNPAALYKKSNKGTSSEGIKSGTGDQGNPNGTYDSKNYEGKPGSGAGTGEGFGEGTGTGDGKGDGISFSLVGRTLKYQLPSPAKNFSENGTVVVQIDVDKNGKVVKAVAIDKGSNTTDANLRRLAEEAARKAVFNANLNAGEVQRGTITYHFVVKN
jgi:periplasmic protein TonB